MRTNSVVIAMSVFWLLVSFWNRNDLPRTINFVSEILTEPLQTVTRKSAFKASYGGVEYLIEPEYEYDLYGMIVSFRHHDGESRMHRAANDHLNMLDVCVVWGDNTTNQRLHKINFWNGIFTCNFQTRDQEAWDSFDIFQVSNNHLISDDELIRDRVRDIQVGDQIRLRGYLASYGSEKDGMRGTSTTRLDAGDGACETIFLERFEIVEPATSYWRISMYLSLALCVIGLLVHFRRPYRPYQRA